MRSRRRRCTRNKRCAKPSRTNAFRPPAPVVVRLCCCTCRFRRSTTKTKYSAWSLLTAKREAPPSTNGTRSCCRRPRRMPPTVFPTIRAFSSSPNRMSGVPGTNRRPLRYPRDKQTKSGKIPINPNRNEQYERFP